MLSKVITKKYLDELTYEVVGAAIEVHKTIQGSQIYLSI